MTSGGRHRGTGVRTRSGFRLPGVVFALIAAFGVMVMMMFRMPGESYRAALQPLTDTEKHLQERLRGHVQVLAGEIGERNLWRPKQLEAAGRYIEDQLKRSSLPVARHHYQVEGRSVDNIEAVWVGTDRPGDIIVVGAHYDSVIGSPGANDNGSGVAALLEIAAIVAARKLPRTVRLVAFVNEEPPFFMTPLMGSRVYARRARRAREQIIAMFSLETIGYYDDRAGSQRYPFPFTLFYPDTGNYIGFVSNLASRHLLRRVLSSFRSHSRFPSEGVVAPGWLTGIGWSDHWSFWKENYPAVMITDTALYRYAPYHTLNDTPEQIDYAGLARVVAGIEQVVADLAENGL